MSKQFMSSGITCKKCERSAYEVNDKIYCMNCHELENECFCPSIREEKYQVGICKHTQKRVLQIKESVNSTWLCLHNNSPEKDEEEVIKFLSSEKSK